MKKILSLLVFSMMMGAAQAQDEEKVDAYFTTGEMLDMLQFLPGPPDNDSPGFAYDVTRYFWGKKKVM